MSEEQPSAICRRWFALDPRAGAQRVCSGTTSRNGSLLTSGEAVGRT